MNAPIRLHIDRLVLDGITLGPGDADRFQAALVETLGELLRVEGVGAGSARSSALGGGGQPRPTFSVMAHGDHPRAPAPSVMAGLDPATHAPAAPHRGGTGAGLLAGSSPAMTERSLRAPAIATGASPIALGQAVARAVHASLTPQPRDGGRT
jgi:hypothetical protein